LQLLEQEAHPEPLADIVEEEEHYFLRNYLNVVGGFLLGPLAAEIADMLQMRYLTPAAPNPPPPLTQEQFFDSQTHLRVVLEVKPCGTIVADESGNMMASFSKGDGTAMPVGDHDFRHVEQNTEATTVKIPTPMGIASAFVSKSVKAGDSILILQDHVHGPRAPITGLVVRPFDRDIHIIVGQVVLGDEFSPAADSGIG
jgi:hypothetical protein